MIPQVVNIIATCSLNVSIDLLTLSKFLKAKYNPNRFTAVIKKFKNPKSTVLIFPNGKLVITGAKFEKDSDLIVKRTKRLLKKFGLNSKITEYKIQNIVATVDFKDFVKKQSGTIIDFYKLSGICSYEPERFAGATMTFNGIKVCIFHNGKLNYLGAKDVESIIRAHEDFIEILLSN